MEYMAMVMYLEIGCFLACLSGWILVCSTIPTEYWSFSEEGSGVMTTVNYYYNLWKTCLTDSTGVHDCKVYPSMLNLPAFLQVSRALILCAVISGFFAGVLTLVGMKCTKIGGSSIANARVTFAGGITYLVSGFCGMITYTWWGNTIIAQFMNQNLIGQKFELGVALFIGWGGSILLIGGATVMCYFSGKEGLSSSSQDPRTAAAYTTGHTRRTYMLPGNASRVTSAAPLLYDGRYSRDTGATRTAITFSRDAFV